jgi:arginine decarboxylase
VPRARHPAPLLLRFTDILKHRVGKLAEAFDTAIRDNDYKGQYRCVYPIKVNQQRHVVEEILEFGKAHGFGSRPAASRSCSR